MKLGCFSSLETSRIQIFEVRMNGSITREKSATIREGDEDEKLANSPATKSQIFCMGDFQLATEEENI